MALLGLIVDKLKFFYETCDELKNIIAVLSNYIHAVDVDYSYLYCSKRMMVFPEIHLHVLIVYMYIQ